LRLNKIAGKNTFIALIILLGLTAALVIGLFILSSFLPNTLGKEPYQYTINSVSFFEPWSFKTELLEADFPQGGIIVNVNETEQNRTLLLLGEGYYYTNDKTILENTRIGGLLLLVDHKLFEEIRGSNIFMPVEDQVLLDQVKLIFNKQKGVPNIWKDRIPLAFHGKDGLSFYYFIDQKGSPLLPPHTNLTWMELLGTFVIYLMFISITMLVMTIFSLDHKYSRYWVHLAGIPPGRFALLLLAPITVLLVASDVLPILYQWSSLTAVFGYLIVIIGLIFAAKYGKIDYLDLGLRRDRLKHGYLLAVITALLILLSAHGIPSGLNAEGIGSIFLLPLIFLLIGLPREMIWRGYIQAVLSRQLGANRGLVAMVLLASLARFIFLVITEPWMLTYPYTYLEVIILAPGLAAILGYLYLRTENILACALLHSLIVWLPGMLIY
jgi:membrane protease YdiL (CAAX protease family)